MEILEPADGEPRFDVVVKTRDGSAYPACMTMPQYKAFIQPWNTSSLISFELENGEFRDYPFHAIEFIHRRPLTLVRFEVPVTEAPGPNKPKRKRAATRKKENTTP